MPNFALPPFMSNHGNYIVSLGNVCRWLIAGADILLGFSARREAQVLTLMNLGNIGLPPLLLLAAFIPALLYLMPLPVTCVLAALSLVSLQAWQADTTRRPGTSLEQRRG